MNSNYEDGLSNGRKYKQYAHLYEAAFAADPDPKLRRYDELAPADDVQWKRLSVYRGNDESAYHAHLTNPMDPLSKPNAKEAEMWEANRQDKWRISREPSYGQHPLTNTKWIEMSTAKRASTSGQMIFNDVDRKYSPGYEKWSQQVDPHTFLEGRVVVAREMMIERNQKREQKLANRQGQSNQIASSEGQTQSHVEVPAAQPGAAQVPAEEAKLAKAREQLDYINSPVSPSLKDADTIKREAINTAIQQGGVGDLNDSGVYVDHMQQVHKRFNSVQSKVDRQDVNVLPLRQSDVILLRAETVAFNVEARSAEIKSMSDSDLAAFKDANLKKHAALGVGTVSESVARETRVREAREQSAMQSQTHSQSNSQVQSQKRTQVQVQ